MGRQHCRLSICENWLSWTNTSIRTKDPNNHSDTETGTLSRRVRQPFKDKVQEKYWPNKLTSGASISQEKAN